MLRDVGFCYVCMTAITTPIVAFSLLGDFAPEGSLQWVKAAVGNLGNLASGGLRQRARLAIVGCQGVPLAALTRVFGWLDAASACVLLIFVATFHFVWVPTHTVQDNIKTVSFADFAVEIDCLPRHLGENHANYEALLHEHLVRHIGANVEHAMEDELPGFRCGGGHITNIAGVVARNRRHPRLCLGVPGMY